MNSSMDEVKEKESAFLQGIFFNVRFSENYCFAVHKGYAESLSDLIHKFDLFHSYINNTGGELLFVFTFMYEVTLTNCNKWPF